MTSFPPTAWRLVHTPPAPGAWNMAVDEAILAAVGQGQALPTLRLYAWNPPCLSLGYAQPASDANLEVLQQRGWDLVRRPTGGRAILHTDELTYSVCGPQDEPRLAGSVLESYQVLAQALLSALQLLNIPATADAKPGTAQLSSPPGQAVAAPVQNTNPVCFEVPSNYEITVQGKKLVGSAQARRREGVLQHGSLPLFGELERIIQALAFPDESSRQRAEQRLSLRATTAERILGAPLPWETAAAAFAQGFCQALNLELVPAPLTSGELEYAQHLVSTKFAHPDWTYKTRS